MGVDISELEQRAIRVLGSRPGALLLYGSQSRGTGHRYSDIDLCAIVSAFPGQHVDGDLSITCYTAAQLEEMVRGRSLFAWHLRTEGTVIFDDNDCLSALNDHLGPDFDAITRQLRLLATVLDVAQSDQEKYSFGLTKVGRHLLRSAIYCRSLESGSPSFDLNRAAAAVGLESLVSLCRTPPKTSSALEVVAIRAAINDLIGLEAKPSSPSSLVTLAVRPSTDDSVVSLAIQALAEDGEELDYAILDTPIV